MNTKLSNAGKNTFESRVAIKKNGITLSIYIYRTFFKIALPPADRATLGTLQAKTQYGSVATRCRHFADSGDSWPSRLVGSVR